MLIVLEGLDGVGKTEATRRLAERLGAVSMRTPGPELAAARALVDASGDRHARFHFYMASLYLASAAIEAHVAAGRTVVCDRYYPTTLVDHADLFDSDTYRSMRRVAESRLYPMSLAFWLTASDAERARRMGLRGPLSPDDLASLDAAESQRLAAGYASFEMTVIDTTDLDADAVASTLLKHVDARRASLRGARSAALDEVTSKRRLYVSE